MSNKMKSVLVIACTLVLGLVLGVVVDSAIHRRRFRRVQEFRNRGGVGAAVNRRARPTAEQRKALKEVMKRYEPRFMEQRERHRAEVEKLMESLKEELGEVLTPEQLERLRDSGRLPMQGPPDPEERRRRPRDRKERVRRRKPER